MRDIGAMRTIRVPEDFVPVDRFEKESSHWVEWVEVSGRPVVVTRRGRAVAVLVSPDDYFGASESLGVLKSLAVEMQRGAPSLAPVRPKRGKAPAPARSPGPRKRRAR